MCAPARPNKLVCIANSRKVVDPRGPSRLNKGNMTGIGGPFRMIPAYTAYTAHTGAVFLYTCSNNYGRTF